MDKIFSQIKGRIVFYIENQGIKKDDFYNKTGISPSNFKGKGAISEIGGDRLARILTEYRNINPDWLLTGQGEMLRNTIPVEFTQAVLPPPNDDIITLLKEQLKEERQHSEKQAQEIGALKNQNIQLREQVMGLDQQILKLSTSLSKFQSTVGDVPSAPVPL